MRLRQGRVMGWVGVWCWLLVSGLLFVGSACKSSTGQEEKVSAQTRLVVVGGTLTEIVYGLGMGSVVVGADASSTYPEEVKREAALGYFRRVSAEGVLGLEPTLIFVTEEAGPAEVIEQLKASGVRVVSFSGAASVGEARERIKAVGDALGKIAEAEHMLKALDEKLAKAAQLRSQVKTTPAVLLLYSHHAGQLHVFGKGTVADALLALVGAKNAANVEGVVPLSGEGVIDAAPDVLLFPSSSVDGLKGLDNVWTIPGIAQSPAGKNKKVIQIDKLALLGFGPRLGDVVLEMMAQLHPELSPGPL